MPRHRLAGVAFSNHGIAFGTETRALVSIMQICFSPLSKETYLNYHLLCFNENAAVYFFPSLLPRLSGQRDAAARSVYDYNTFVRTQAMRRA